MKYILITGSPLDGFIYEGPFYDPTSAGEYARKTSPRNSKYWVSHMREPQESDLERIDTKLDILDNDECTCDDDMCNPCIARDIVDKADTDSYASSLPGIDYHNIMDEEDIAL